MSRKATWSAPTSNGDCSARFTSTLQATASSWRTWPKVNARRNVPNVEGARPAVNTRSIPPWRSRSMSSMLSAPATIPATKAATFTPGFAPAEPGTRTWAAARSCCPASRRWQVLRLGKVGDRRVGEAEVDLDRAVPGQVLVGSDGVVLDPVMLDVSGQVDRVGDLFEEQPLVLQRPEAAFA